MASKRKRILIVDDDRYMAESLAAILAPMLPADIAVAGGVDEALQFVDAARYALVITDVRMDPGAFFRPIQTAGGFRTGIFLAREIQNRQPRARIIGLSSWDDPDVHQWFTQNATVAFMQKPPDLRRLANLARGMLHPKRQLPQVFIVHGRDVASVFELKDFLQNRLGFPEPIVLDEQPSQGKAIIEKFEHYAAQVDIAFVLLTPDDVGHLAEEPASPQPRPRQNPVFELGYFLGIMGRHSGRVILLYKGYLEIPSDIAGVVYIDIARGVPAAGEAIRRELKRWL